MFLQLSCERLVSGVNDFRILQPLFFILLKVFENSLLIFFRQGIIRQNIFFKICLIVISQFFSKICLLLIVFLRILFQGYIRMMSRMAIFRQSHKSILLLIFINNKFRMSGFFRTAFFFLVSSKNEQLFFLARHRKSPEKLVIKVLKANNRTFVKILLCRSQRLALTFIITYVLRTSS